MRGVSAIRQLSTELNNRSKAGGNFAKELWQGLRNVGDSVQVRFLEQGEDIHICWAHEYQRGKRFLYTPCLDEDSSGQPCAGCELGLKRTIKGNINVIWRDSPQLKRNADGKAVKDQAGRFVIDGVKDEVAVWQQGISVFEDLADKDVKYKGLMSRDFVITKKSKGYGIDPATNENGDVVATPMTESDRELEKNKYDLDEFMPVLSYEDQAKLLAGGTLPTGGGVSDDDVQESREAGSPWNRGTGQSRANRFLDN
jgi:hypothetical protein